MQSFVKIMVWIYSLKIGHYHSFPDKRHGKEGGVGGGGSNERGDFESRGGGVTYHQEVLFLCMLVCLHHAKKKNRQLWQHSHLLRK